MIFRSRFDTFCRLIELILLENFRHHSPCVGVRIPPSLPISVCSISQRGPHLSSLLSQVFLIPADDQLLLPSQSETLAHDLNVGSLGYLADTLLLSSTVWKHPATNNARVNKIHIVKYRFITRSQLNGRHRMSFTDVQRPRGVAATALQ